jgi:hypothetical protein
MALTSYKITKKLFETYYSPKVSKFDIMVSSINSPMGYGQIIESYIGSDVINTYYHVWDNSLEVQVVMDATSGNVYSVDQAGPMFWEVTSQQGISFLNGTISISGLRKLKYCNGCEDRNTIVYPSLVDFKKKFSEVGNLITQYNTLDGYLFYDTTLPRFSNVFPATKEDDGINVTFRFKTVDGTDKTLSEISQITSKPIIEIEESIDLSDPVKPEEGVNSVIVSCCDEKLYHVVEGQMKIGATATSSSYFDGSKSWYVESYTNDESTIPRGITFTYGERSCKSGIINNPCGGLPTSSILRSCCRAPTLIIDGVYAIGTVLYTKDVSPATCYQVTDNTTDSPTSYYRFDEFIGDCRKCTSIYPGGCN